jgi:RimJ/RimL family protein N-acetyltransferase
LALSFRVVEVGDLRLVHEWLQREHVRRWWRQRESYEQVLDSYLPAIEGRDPTDLYLVLLNGREIGFIETYLLVDYPGYAALIGAGEGTAGVDLFIADSALTGRGIGSETLRRFVSQIVFARETTRRCVAGPEVANVASVRALENAGFRMVREFVEEGTRASCFSSTGSRTLVSVEATDANRADGRFRGVRVTCERSRRQTLLLPVGAV